MDSTRKGILLALAGVTILSFDSLLVRLIQASPWDLLFWRGTLLSLTLMLVNALTRHFHPPAPSRDRPSSLQPLLGGAAFACSTVLFVLALSHTQVTSALVIINTAPFFAALIALLFLRESLQLHTLAAIVVATCGVGLIFEYAPKASEIQGDLYALGAALGTACYLVVMRAAKGENGAKTLMMAGVFTALFALFKGADPTALSGTHLLLMLILGVLVVPGSGLCIARAPKYLPAAQTGLILLLEILLGPLFVFLALGERPSDNDIAGGTLVLWTLVAHTLYDEFRQRRKGSPP
ncbi:DMT family transporter [Ferrimonas gelatinilytica]|uniref:EamA family transporter n=1 Tax=Ferrimonas gelatinilytica TaxID=1255257 RepID=A0ABP9RYD8_9GAMM